MSVIYVEIFKILDDYDRDPISLSLIMLKIASETEVLAFLKETYGSRKRKYLGFYNSLFDKVIVDQQYMLMPVDDRTSTRGHGVFDVIYLKNFKLRNLDKHISRLHKSA